MIIENKLIMNCKVDINNIAYLEYMNKQEKDQVNKNNSFGAGMGVDRLTLRDNQTASQNIPSRL